MPSLALNDVDLELLELLTLEVPWYMVCGDFHDRYGSPGALARRLFELRELGLIVVGAQGDDPCTPQALEADALANGCYQDLDGTYDPRWDMVATDDGFALVKSLLDEQ